MYYLSTNPKKIRKSFPEVCDPEAILNYLDRNDFHEILNYESLYTDMSERLDGAERPAYIVGKGLKGDNSFGDWGKYIMFCCKGHNISEKNPVFFIRFIDREKERERYVMWTDVIQYGYLDKGKTVFDDYEDIVDKINEVIYSNG